MSALVPGDIVEMTTPRGRAHALVTHDHPSYPQVVRVLAGLHQAPLHDPAAAAQGTVAFTAMLPLESALRRLDWPHRVVAHVPVPPALADFPTFRTPIRDRDGNIVYWWFWDGRSLRYDATLRPGEDTLPLREVMSADQFAKRLAAL